MSIPRRLLDVVPIWLWPWLSFVAAIGIIVLFYGLFIAAISMND